jgi:hypothetical protein
MPAFLYADGTPVEVGDRVRLEDGQWRGVVEACFEEAGPSGWPPERGVFVRYVEVGSEFYPNEIEPDVVLMARESP